MARWQVLARNPDNNRVRQVVRGGKNRDGVRRRWRLAGRHETLKGHRLSRRDSKRAAKWARGKGLVPYRSRDRWPWLVLDTDTRYPRRDVCRRLSRVAQNTGRYLFIREGWRTNARQWELYRAYGPGRAAYPGTSRHESGNAADVGVFTRGRSGWQPNVGSWPGARAAMRRHGLCLNVPGEDWHCEAGTLWRA